MGKLIAVVEGLTEQTFIREVLGPWLWERTGVQLVGSPAGKPGKKGGNSFDKVRLDIINHLKNPHFSAVTTFFDYYGMSPRWPGRSQPPNLTQSQKPVYVEESIRDNIAAAYGEELTNRFVPYVQMHEFEALLFSDTAVLPNIMQEQGKKPLLDAALADVGSPEEINDSPASAPSKRILGVFPNFRKTFHGVLTAKEITIDVMMNVCPHFREWVSKLQLFGQQAT